MKSPSLNYGPLATNIVIKPRLAPGACSDWGCSRRRPRIPCESGPGRFGWQATALSVRDQTTRALSREMGVTSADRPRG